MSNQKPSKKDISKIEAWIDLKNRALRLFGEDSVEYIFSSFISELYFSFMERFIRYRLSFVS